MQNWEVKFHKICGSQNPSVTRWLTIVIAVWAISPVSKAFCTEEPDPVIGLMLEKGMITEREATNVQAQLDARRANPPAQFPESKWRINTSIKDMEVFGDLRLRYEDRLAVDPTGGRIDLQRERYSLRFGLRGEALDNVYYGFRLETSSNPRSSWVSLGTSSGGTTYQDPFGKSTAGINIGQIYMGWRPASWLDITAGKMPNPLYTTPMVWSPSINPEGLAEHLKYTVGEMELFANFGQFLYQDLNPSSASSGLGFNGLFGQTANNIFQIDWQAGLIYHITTNTSFKVGATFYQYFGLQQSSQLNITPLAPYFGDPYVGEGAYTGPGSDNLINGYSGYGGGSGLPGHGSVGYPNNQVGLNNLEVLEVPFEINFKISHLDARIFGDMAYNFQGSQRATAAATAYATYLANQATPATIHAFAPQTHDCKAYQIGFALGSEGGLGLVNGTTAKKHAWEVRTYWQHTEQYALDPNLLDLDLFNGLENLQGVYAAAAYSFTDNFIGTVRYGYATRINNNLGTGGSSGDIPQINPISQYNILQADLTFKF